MTAADAGKSVDSVTPAGTEIIYNACFINGEKAVPYLATRSVFFGYHKFTTISLILFIKMHGYSWSQDLVII
jgi:hypothetical protein